ncbi:hypothetical protein J2W49_005139 [Hydrogenophaga palleronii]|uniref:DUF1513 domain-containing protein n=1 Tax=Hydrogenophaga palleronii TaxID=65655 RepID=A0ABU1WVR3_9BURK|nr:DUF1513 domain-containing protein [Hydrogenophaga palleronii]MDR7153159.1 hypothetical protein [Hydrogenophaga palleronii]
MQTSTAADDSATPAGAISRRRWLMGAAALGLAPAWAARENAQLVAAWQASAKQRIGVIEVGAQHWSVRQTLAVPTRAHGLLVEAGGSVLAVARRPGDWLLRWHPVSGQTLWHWIEDDRRFNGHAAASADGRRVWTSETDLETAQGQLAVRDGTTLAKTTEWPTQGMDPHELLVLPQRVGAIPAGSLIVANGGIPTLPETGRSKRELGRMDASLVALDARDGGLLGQWRLPDPHLSIRHLAWDTASGTVGIALQAEHPDAGTRQRAPVFAAWDGQRLQAAIGQPALQGYGGDICALPGGGFVVSCPRANNLALFTASARWVRNQTHEGASALARHDRHWWASGTESLWCAPEGVRAHSAGASVQFDNHWQGWPRA